MASATYSYEISMDGTLFRSADTLTSDNATKSDPTLAVAKVGQLTTRGSASAGTLTMAASHGITTAARLDVYWDGGRRYGVTVGTVSGNSVPFSLGDGDDLPTNLTAVTAMLPADEQFVVTAANVTALMAQSPADAATAVFDDGESVTLAILLTGPTGSYTWKSGDAPNPITAAGIGTTVKVYLSHGDSASSRKVSVFAMRD